MIPIDQENTPSHALLFYAKELFIAVIIGVIIALPVWSFVMRAFLVHGSSMYPTFNQSETSGYNDYLFVELLSYRFDDPERGDVVVFQSKENNSTDEYLLKRVIGLPGERVVLDENDIFIHKGGKVFKLDEPYINSNPSTYTKGVFDLSYDEYFFLGDNRDNSNDSRSFGAIKEDHILGKIFLRVFPFTQFTIFNQEKDFSVSEILVTQ